MSRRPVAHGSAVAGGAVIVDVMPRNGRAAGARLQVVASLIAVAALVLPPDGGSP